MKKLIFITIVMILSVGFLFSFNIKDFRKIIKNPNFSVVFYSYNKTTDTMSFDVSSDKDAGDISLYFYDLYQYTMSLENNDNFVSYIKVFCILTKEEFILDVKRFRKTNTYQQLQEMQNKKIKQLK